MPDWIGTRLSADINLVAQLAMLAGLWVELLEFRYRRRHHRRHRRKIDDGSRYPGNPGGGHRVSDLILRMRTEVIPPRFRVRNFKPVMQTTLGLWTILVLMGVGVYYYRYLEPESESPTAPLIQLERANIDLIIHARELELAVERGNLRTTKRHAEHLVNLIDLHCPSAQKVGT